MAKMQKLQKLNMTFFFSILFIGLLWRSWRKCEICGLCHLKESGGNVFSQIVSMQILSFPGRVSLNSGESEAGLAELTRQLSAVSPLPAMSLEVRPCLTTCLSNYISIFNLPARAETGWLSQLSPSVLSSISYDCRNNVPSVRWGTIILIPAHLTKTLLETKNVTRKSKYIN